MAKRGLTLTDFISPENEISVLKSVPNTDYWHDVVSRALAAFMSEYGMCIQNFNVRKRYRGPRWQSVRDCRKEDGWSFSLYIHEPKRPFKPFDNAVLILANEIKNAGVHALETGEIKFSEWLKETDFTDPYNSMFVNHEWYYRYRNELERYFTQSLVSKSTAMFVDFIREKHMSQLDK